LPPRTQAQAQGVKACPQRHMRGLDDAALTAIAFSGLAGTWIARVVHG
jgi:hypothetical protein